MTDNLYIKWYMDQFRVGGKVTRGRVVWEVWRHRLEKNRNQPLDTQTLRRSASEIFDVP